MKKYPILFLSGCLLFFSCKTDKKSAVETPKKELSLLEKIADANGFQNWKNVNELRFTFNVDRDTSHFERSWIWKPKTNEVTSLMAKDTLSYERKSMDSIAIKTDHAFINDKYWLLAPINLLWDKDHITYTHTKEALAPISKKSMQKLTVVYHSEGGYTPGDAYDFYFGDDFMVKEWVYRKGNQPKPSMTTTWENYENKNGLTLSTMHTNAEGNFKLYFTNIQVRTNKG